MIGQIARFDALRRYGFIALGDGSPNVFFQTANVFSGQSSICEGAQVTFKLFNDGSTRHAEHVKVIQVQPPTAPTHLRD